jgi:hypothetical protein
VLVLWRPHVVAAQQKPGEQTVVKETTMCYAPTCTQAMSLQSTS